MKLACVLAASATASLFEESDRKFSDQPDWIADEIWENWGNKSPAYRVAQLKCRVDMFVEGVFSDAPAPLKASIKKNWEGVAGTIEHAFFKCTGKFIPPKVNCAWRDWLHDEDLTVDNKVNTFVVWNGVAVRETMYNNGCEARAMRIVSNIL